MATAKSWRLLRLVIIGATFQLIHAAPAVDRYVAPNGTNKNAGTMRLPWDLQTAMETAQPGETVWLRGGTYSGTFVCWVSGKQGQPIIFRQYPGEKVSIDGGQNKGPALNVLGANVWFWGFEIYYSDHRRTSTQRGSFPSDIYRGNNTETAAPGVKFINMVLHDGWGSIGAWAKAADAEIYGNIIYFDGWDSVDRGHGHGIYVQNDGTQVRHIEENIMLSAFSHGLHAYSTSTDAVQNLLIQGNVAVDNGQLSRSGYATNFRVDSYRGVPRHITFRDNYAYFSPVREGGDNQIGSASAGCSEVEVTGNHFISPKGIALIRPRKCTGIVMKNNVFYGATVGFAPADFPENAYYTAPPHGTEVFLRPNRYENGRLMIIIYNWDHKPSVPVDLSSSLELGANYEIYDAQNFLGPPVVKGIYKGATLILPMNLEKVPAPMGSVAVLPKHSDSVFGVFLLLSCKAH
jgi:hypothetical protein